MQIADKYSPQEIESKWYDYWMEHRLFHSEPDEREPYTIVIPPPNVTGMLHMGHMLNNTLQDVLVRRARMQGKNACWVPGTDHASIATEAKVVAKLKAEGIEKSSLSREEFLRHAWDWKEKYGGVILQQLRKLGASCDWERTCFTMDEARTESVLRVFCDLYEKGLIYRGVRMVNWDPSAQTALSDEEVVFKGVARQALLPALPGRRHRPHDHRRHDPARNDPRRYGPLRQSRRRTLRLAARRRPGHRPAGGPVGARDPRYVRGHRFRHGCPEGYAGARCERLYAR